jgi:exonuclease VII small subunit
LQAENAALQTDAQAAVEAYEAEISRRGAELAEAIAWGRAREAELQGQLEASVAEYTRCMADYTNAVAEYANAEAEYRKCLAKFQQAEMTIEERSRWALDLQAEIDNLTAQMESIRGSRWVRLGRSLGMGPKVG